MARERGKTAFFFNSWYHTQKDYEEVLARAKELKERYPEGFYRMSAGSFHEPKTSLAVRYKGRSGNGKLVSWDQLSEKYLRDCVLADFEAWSLSRKNY